MSRPPDSEFIVDVTVFTADGEPLDSRSEPSHAPPSRPRTRSPGTWPSATTGPPRT